MRLDKTGIKFIQGNEIEKLTSYEDPTGSGKYSIGWGTQIATSEMWAIVNASQDSISKGQADKWLLDYIHDRIEPYISRNIRAPLTEGQYRAIGDYIYNTGSLGPKFLHFINSADYYHAAFELDANKVQGNFSSVLWKRRTQEQEQFLRTTPDLSIPP